jgi:hypothetical protein
MTHLHYSMPDVLEYLTLTDNMPADNTITLSTLNADIVDVTYLQLVQTSMLSLTSIYPLY